MKKLAMIVLLLAGGLTAGCDNGKKKKKTTTNDTVATKPKTDKTDESQTTKEEALFQDVKGDNPSIKLEILPFDKNKLPKLMQKYKGKLVNGGHWRDKGGEHWVLLTETGKIEEKKGKTDTSGHLIEEPMVSAEAHAYFWVKKHDSYINYRRDYWIEKCGPFDVLAEFLPQGFSITDVNNNGKAEVTLTYKHYCRSDVSPANLTLRMIEAKKMYEMHGTTRLRTGTQEDAYVIKSTRKAGTFIQAPATFHTHVNEVWEKVEEEKL
ncbi:M949_RS01915 family surface polysaccharide biosynthesis protein [Microscilla marina]|nr:hypothetical protein [Microscilla marina]